MLCVLLNPGKTKKGLILYVTGVKNTVHAKSLQSCPTLHNPMGCSPPGSSVIGILQARTLEWLPCPSPDLPDPGIKPASLTFPA